LRAGAGVDDHRPENGESSAGVVEGGEQVDVRKKPQTGENGIFKGRRRIPYGIAEMGVCRGGTDAAFTLNVFERPDQPPTASAGAWA
jgi:hypothetical protein